MERNIEGSALEAFRGGLRGVAYAPGEEGYDEGKQAFNLNARQHLALVVMGPTGSRRGTTPFLTRVW